MKHVSDSPLGPKGLIKAAESPEFCCGCYGCCCCCFFLSAFCLLYVCSLFFVGPFALDNLTSLKYVAFVICFLVPILVLGPRVLATAAADNATFGGIGAIKLLLYIFFFWPTAAATQRHFMLWQAHTTPPHINEAQLEPTPREDALTIITLASSTRPSRPNVKKHSLYSLLLFQHYFKCYFPYLGIDK